MDTEILNDLKEATDSMGKAYGRLKGEDAPGAIPPEQEAISRFVTDGCYIGTELYGTVRCPMSLAREVVRQGKKDLQR
jgi:hypothetical protein